jgi:hypothetical protein
MRSPVRGSMRRAAGRWSADFSGRRPSRAPAVYTAERPGVHNVFPSRAVEQVRPRLHQLAASPAYGRREGRSTLSPMRAQPRRPRAASSCTPCQATPDLTPV